MSIDHFLPRRTWHRVVVIGVAAVVGLGVVANLTGSGDPETPAAAAPADLAEAEAPATVTVEVSDPDAYNQGYEKGREDGAAEQDRMAPNPVTETVTETVTEAAPAPAPEADPAPAPAPAASSDTGAQLPMQAGDWRLDTIRIENGFDDDFSGDARVTYTGGDTEGGTNLFTVTVFVAGQPVGSLMGTASDVVPGDTVSVTLISTDKHVPGPYTFDFQNDL